MKTSAYYDGLFLAKKAMEKPEQKPQVKSRAKSNDEILAEIRRMSPERRHILSLCDLRSHFERAKSCTKSCVATWDFENDYEKLKRLMKLHSWNKEFILVTFGVDFKVATKLFFALKD